MRNENQIQRQLNLVIRRHLQKMTRTNAKVVPDRCIHNKRVLLQPYPIGFCAYLVDGKPRWIPCDLRVEGGADQVRDCAWWTPLKTEEQIREEFQQLLASKDRGRIAAEFPDVAALMWVLDDPAPNLFDILAEEPPEGENGK